MKTWVRYAAIWVLALVGCSRHPADVQASNGLATAEVEDNNSSVESRPTAVRAEDDSRAHQGLDALKDYPSSPTWPVAKPGDMSAADRDKFTVNCTLTNDDMALRKLGCDHKAIHVDNPLNHIVVEPVKSVF